RILRRASQPAVAREDVDEPFFEQHAQRLPESGEQEGRGCVWKEPLLHVADQRTPIVEVSRRSILLGGRERSWPDAENCAAWRQHESLLRAGERDIDTPLIHPEIYRPKRADDNDEKKWIAAGPIDAGPGGDKIRRYAGGGCGVDD